MYTPYYTRCIHAEYNGTYRYSDGNPILFMKRFLAMYSTYEGTDALSLDTPLGQLNLHPICTKDRDLIHEYLNIMIMKKNISKCLYTNLVQTIMQYDLSKK